MPISGGSFVTEHTGSAIQSKWTSQTIWNTHSGNRWGIENFEADSPHTLADYDEVDADATCSADNTTFVLTSFTAPPNGDYVRKITAIFANSTSNRCGQTITFNFPDSSLADWSLKDTLYFQFYGDNSGNKIYVQLNQGGVWGGQVEVDTIDWNEWKEVAYTLSGTRDDIQGIRILIQNFAGDGSYEYFLDLVQVAEITRGCEFQNLIFTSSIPSGATITVEFYDNDDDTLLKSVNLVGGAVEVLPVYTYPELSNKDIYIELVGTRTGAGVPTVTSMELSTRADILGDWSLREVLASYG